MSWRSVSKSGTRLCGSEGECYDWQSQARGKLAGNSKPWRRPTHSRAHPVARERQRPTDIAASKLCSSPCLCLSLGGAEGRKEGRKQKRKKEGRKLFREKPDSSSVRCQIRDRLKLFASITKLRQNGNWHQGIYVRSLIGVPQQALLECS